MTDVFDEKHKLALALTARVGDLMISGSLKSLLPLREGELRHE